MRAHHAKNPCARLQDKRLHLCHIVSLGREASPKRLVKQDVVQVWAGVVVADHDAQHAEGPQVCEVHVVHHAVVAVGPAHLAPAE